MGVLPRGGPAWREIIDEGLAEWRKADARRLATDPVYRAAQERFDAEYDAAFGKAKGHQAAPK